MNTIEERFKKFKSPNYYSRVDEYHPLELYIGLDSKSRYSIELRHVSKPRKVTGTASIDVGQFDKGKYNSIEFSLEDKEVSGLFYKFCEDLIEQTKSINDISLGYITIVNRYFQWKKMFVSSKKHLLDETNIKGLIGEILFLKGNLADRIGLSCALKSWTGQELTHKDFSYGDIWFESKAISKNANSIKISSLEQLDSDKEGELVVHVLEKMSPTFNGITLNKLILETQSLFESDEDRDIFLMKAKEQGYEYNNYYDNFVYQVCGFKRFRVDDSFPRLTKNSVPKPIIKSVYEIAITEILEFEII